jgi:hypothetical protein
MKSVISTITVLTVFSLAIVSSVSAQNSREKEIEAMKKDLTAAGIEQIEVEKAIRNEVENAIRETAAENARMAEKMKIEKLFLDLNAQSVRLQEQRVRGRVLVVPTADTKAGDFASIMQDMNIMTHIFDKKLNYSSRLNDGATIVLGGLAFHFGRRQGHKSHVRWGLRSSIFYKSQFSALASGGIESEDIRRRCRPRLGRCKT